MGEQTLLTISDLVAVLIMIQVPMLILLGTLVYQIARLNRSAKAILTQAKIRQEVARSNRYSAYPAAD